MSPSSVPRRAAVLPLAAALLLAGAAFSAAAGGGAHVERIRQELPLTAAEFEHGDCPAELVPADRDGWHFALPGGSTVLTRLTVTFEPGGRQVVTAFGPPDDRHAYVASAPGARLVGAVAETEGADIEYVGLSHTCPATVGAAAGGEGDGPARGVDEQVTATTVSAVAAADDLPETGAGSVTGLVFAAALLVATGGAIAVRDRKGGAGG
ncbi:LPXTG cell wall anchor domain-containing protein [Streptomyces sp. NPDC005012]|uniref:LPXTG cell wall anchor domain-containing protein n=1 Tax=Streptomyces sp. NPDC005012 TaxID=3154558 RepID=UPI0033B25E99